MKTRLALPDDVGQIRQLIDRYSNEGMLLPRSLDDLRAHLGNFIVVTQTAQSSEAAAAEKLLGCVALENYAADLAEIRSLAVAPEAWRRGLGGKLLEAALAEGRQRRIARIFAVTHAPHLFKQHGFVEMPRQALPEKIARDCRTCNKAGNCELVAVIAVVCTDKRCPDNSGRDRTAMPLARQAEKVLTIL